MFIEVVDLRSRYDVVVIGAGAVGLTLSVDSAKKGARVLLLEAGPRTSAGPESEKFRSEVSGRSFRGAIDGRARVLGGTTTRWGGQFLPLPASVFESRPWLGAPDWPVTLEDLAPYYERAANLFGLRAARPASPWTASSASWWGDLTVEFSQWTPTPNFAARFSETLARDSRIDVLIDAQVVDLHSTDDGVDGFTLLTSTGLQRHDVTGLYVLAAGTLESTRLVHNAAGLKGAINPSALARVGVGFHDHVAIKGAKVVVTNRKGFHHLFDGFLVEGVKVTAKLTLSPEVKRREGLVDAGGFFELGDGGEGPRAVRAALQHLRRKHGSGKILAEIWTGTRHLPSVIRFAWCLAVKKRIPGDRHQDVWLHLHAEQAPLEESRIGVGSAVIDDRDGPPAVVEWHVSDASRRAMRRLADEIDAALRASELGYLAPYDVLADPDEFQVALSDSLHHMGGLAMSGHVDDGVCDRDAKVYGIANLYVAGAALFPTGGYSNPTHTALALALRLSDHLAVTRGAADSDADPDDAE